MRLDTRIRMNEKLPLRDPQSSAPGRRIIFLDPARQAAYESFSFKKPADKISTTEATIYCDFENKHRLPVYRTHWYRSLLEYKVVFSINNLKDPKPGFAPSSDSWSRSRSDRCHLSLSASTKGICS